MIVQAAKVLVLELVGEVLYFPLWWYSQGLKRHLLYVIQGIKNLNRNLSLGLMFKNMFKPMFGQYDRAGRAISFFMRLLLLFSRLAVFIVLALGYVLILAGWIFLPVLVTWMIMRNFTSIWQS